MAALAALSVWACSLQEDHAILSLFFDGVPTPEELAAWEMAEQARMDQAAILALPLSSAERAALLATRIEAMEVTEHPPVRDDLCEACHTERLNEGAVATGWKTDLPKFKAPLEELCFQCHEPPAAAYAHGPAASGCCSICHQAHTSLTPHLLHNARQRELCSACHDPSILETSAAHEASAELDCVVCHDPHGSETQYLLRPDWQALEAHEKAVLETPAED